MQIKVRGLNLVKGALSRLAIVEIILEYAQRNAKVRRLAEVTITFVPIIVFEGIKRGGLQTGSKITISTQNHRGRRLDVHELVQTIYHELYHLNANGLSNCRPGAKGVLSDYDPSEWQQELGAIMSSNIELTNWSARVCRRHSLAELKEIAPYSRDWPDMT